MKAKNDKQVETINELTADLQRLRADFENYRKRVDAEKQQVSVMAQASTIMKLLPVIDTIERAVTHVPAELTENKWAQGVVGLGKNLEKSLGDLGLVRIVAAPNTPFDPILHEAVAMSDGEGDHEVIEEELRAGYMLGGEVIRPSMVRVTHAPVDVR